MNPLTGRVLSCVIQIKLTPLGLILCWFEVELGVLVGLGVGVGGAVGVRVLIGVIGGHEGRQKPQLPWPPMCSKSLSTFVEHQ